MLGAALIAMACGPAAAEPATANDAECSLVHITSGPIEADAPVSIRSVSTERLSDAGARYCLVRLRVGGDVNMAIGLPMDGRWNGRLQAEGVGGYGGRALPPVRAVARGYVGVQTDTGHVAGAHHPGDGPDDNWRVMVGAFAMRAPGVPDLARQNDFAHRSAHLMAVVGRQVASVFYGHSPSHAYFNGCSTEGRQGLRAAQQYPNDYDGILAGDPAINFAEVMAFQIWPQLVMKDIVGGPILPAKMALATTRAVEACDGLDGLGDGLLTDPRQCRYRASLDEMITRPDCRADEGDCLSEQEAAAIDAIWDGPREADGRSLWYGIPRGAPLDLLAGERPFPYAIVQPRYWVFLNPRWDWRTLTLERYAAFFRRSVAAVDPIMGSNDPDLRRFFDRGGRIILYHGFNDSGILPQGSIDYLDAVASEMRLSDAELKSRFRLFLFPGVGHCRGGDAPQPPVDGMLDALVDWVEQDTPPDTLTAVQEYPNDRTRSRPVCTYPSLPYYSGHGDPDLASSFVCRR